jgi:hypothetical protein
MQVQLPQIKHPMQYKKVLYTLEREALNQGLTYMAISRETTIGCLGHMTTIPNNYEQCKYIF